MTLRQPPPHTRATQAGFTLIELMVGLVIGMLATMIILQVFSVFEAQKRTTTGTADAQTNGSIALYNISRELQLAGYPLMPSTDSPLECTALTVAGVAGNVSTLAPVSITNGVSDSITLRYGNSLMGGVPTAITAVGAPTANDVTVANNFGCLTNDSILITNGTSCNMTIVTAAASATPTTVTLGNITGAIAGANIACFGTWNGITYAVNNGSLERNGVPSVADVVNLQAQYGISAAANSNQVTGWVNATTGGIWDPALISVADRNRIKAIRIAVVARNPKMEPAAVTTTCSALDAAAPTGLCAWAGSVASPAPAIDLSADANWQRYRYRVFETIVPLRNVIWSKDSL